MNMKRTRIFLSVLAFTGIFLSISILRICVFKNKSYSENAAMQRTESITVKNHRGIFFDRNLHPLVDNSVKTYAVSENGEITEKDGNISIYATERYGKKALASHLIGYTDNEGNGISGLEKCFDKILKTNEFFKVNVITTATGKVLESAGSNVVNNDIKADAVKLTIDSHIQRIAENCFDKSGFDGAVVVMDIKNSDILAMVSRPQYDRNKVSDYLNSNGSELVNRCISSYDAGSIFKIITSAAAIEEGFDNNTYNCKGFLDIEGRIFNCHFHDGHGDVDFEKAFLNSCNCAFYEMGIKTGAEKILETAKKFGLGEKLLCYDGLSEMTGNIPQKTSYGIHESVNYSIGQGDILITPVQAANMVSIIANNGIANCVNVAESITDYRGAVKRNLRETNERRVISFDTAQKIQKCMRLAVTEGTAKGADSPYIKIAGKTGTAQTGWVKDGESLVHGWFCGYFPYDNPKYAMAVLAENGKSGSESAVPVFKEIAEEIIKFYPVG